MRLPQSHLGFAAVLLLASPAAATDTPGSGYRLDPRPYPGGILALTLSDGDIVTFDQRTVARWDADGTFLLTLASFDTCDPFVFPPSDCLYPGLFELDPDETFLLFGESSFGDVYRVDLLGGGKTLLANIPYNYDAAFEDGRYAVVSAAEASFAGNELTRLDTQTGATEPVAFLLGFSGPVAVDAAGSLYYGSQDTGEVLRFSSAETHGGATLDEGDAFVFATGFDLAAQLVAGDAPGELYLAESDFGTAAYGLWRLGATPALSELVADGPDGQSIGSLQFTTGIRGASFLAYQPAFGGSLHYTTRDFGTVTERYEVRPARPQAAFSGPGLLGPGVVDFDLDGGPAVGLVVLLYGPQPLYDAVETAYTNPGMPPLFTGLDLFTTKILPIVFFTDAAGHMSFPFFNDGGLTGALAMQGAVFDLGGNMLGLSTTALN